LVLRLQRALGAFTLGWLLGVVPLFCEWRASGIVVTGTHLVGFGTLAGLAAAIAYLVLSIWLRAEIARRWSVVAATAVVSAEIFYLVNVAVLPEATWTAAPSLIGTGAMLAVVWTPLLLAARRERAVSTLEDRLAAAVGAGLLALAGWTFWHALPDHPAPAPARSGSGPHVLLIVVDGARRDHLSLYGYALPTSPNIASAARSGRVYSRAFSASSWTLDSVKVMLGVGTARDRLDTLPRRLAARGYVTACFSDNPLLDHGGPFSGLFDRYGQSTAPALVAIPRVFDGTFLGEFVLRWTLLARRWDDARLVEKAGDWVARQDGPVFLYVHLMDPHVPLRKPSFDGRTWRRRAIANPDATLTKEEAEDVVSYYDGALRSADAAVGRLLAAAAGWRRPYLAIVTADHGESLGDQGRWMHGRSLAPELLAVPLVLIGEGVAPGWVDAPVGHQSIETTLLAAAGWRTPDPRGSDLRTSEGDTAVGGALPPHLFYELAAGYQVVLDKRTAAVQVLDLGTGLDQAGRLTVEDQVAVRAAVARLMERGRAVTEPSEAPDPALRERLRSLGYIE
jgi:hypothetical protein